MMFGDSNIQDGGVVGKLQTIHGYLGVGSQENPAGVHHEGYAPSRAAHDMVTNAGFPIHPTMSNNFANFWASGYPNPSDPPDVVVVAFGTNWLKGWASGFGTGLWPAQVAAAFQGSLVRYFKNLWPTAQVIATLFVNGLDDPDHVNWEVYEVPPHNAPVGEGRAYWLARRDEYAAEYEAHHIGYADAYVRLDLNAATAFSDDVHMTDAGYTEYAALIDATIRGVTVGPIMQRQDIIDAVQPVLDALGAPLDYSLAAPQSIDAVVASANAPETGRAAVHVFPVPTTGLRVRFAGQDVTVTKT
jgi:hypothetical protein